LRFFFAFIAVAAIAAAAMSVPHAADARGKPAPAASPSASASPSAAPTASPEPPDVAIPKLQAKIKANPRDRDSILQLTGYYLQIGRPDLALQGVQTLEQLGTKTAQVYYLGGYANMQLGRFPQASSDLENAENLEPTNIGVLSMLADAYIRQNKLSDADRVAKRAIAFNKNDKAAYETYGGVLEAQEKYDDARAQYDIAAKLDPKDPQPILLEARTYVKQNAIALGSALYDRALTLDPDNAEALSGKAQILEQEHNVKDAIATFERLRSVVTTPDEKAAVLVDEARLYANEKMDDQAVITYKSAISTYPAVLNTHVAYGDYLAAKNNMNEAVSEWTAGLGTNRDNRDALGRLGSYYADKKDFPKSLDYLKRLVEISPNDPRAYSLIGSVYAEQNNWKDAHDAFKHAFDLTHAPDALKAVGQTDLNLHNYKEAQQIFEAIDKNGGDYVKHDPTVIYMLGQSYQKQGMKQQAKSAYQRFLAYLKPGTQAYSQVQKMIDDIDHGGTNRQNSHGGKTTSNK
jgi:tetratricopeptide (TPR) repeat protein